MTLVTGVLFDYGHTLVNANSVETIFRLALQSLGHEVDRERLSRALACQRDHWSKNYSTLPRGFRWTTEIRKDCNAVLLRELRLGEDVEDIMSAIEVGWRKHQSLRLFEDVLPVLKSLSKKGLRLGVVSQNFRTSLDLHSELQDLGIGDFFEFVLTSEDAGFDKPDPRIFLLASQRLNLHARSLCHVGNDYDKDVLGARAAGITPILINREGRSEARDCIVVQAMSEVEELLSRL